MTSKVLDLTTIGHALNELCTAFFHEPEWLALNNEQQEFLTWYMDHRDEISKLDNLEALASINAAELNAFLKSHGFDPMFDPFNGIGVAAILDMLVQWVVEGDSTTITRYELDNSADHRDTYGRPILTTAPVNYPAFRIYSEGADVYDVAGYWEPLVRLSTKTNHHLWLMRADEPKSGLELNRQAQRLLRATRRQHLGYVGVMVPMLEMNIRADLSWITGMKITSTTGNYAIEKAFQQFKLRADTTGAHVKVATGFAVATASCGPTPEPYVFDEPFIGFFTQPGNDTLPIAAFWADTDSWHEPTTES